MVEGGGDVYARVETFRSDLNCNRDQNNHVSVHIPNYNPALTMQVRRVWPLNPPNKLSDGET